MQELSWLKASDHGFISEVDNLKWPWTDTQCYKDLKISEAHEGCSASEWKLVVIRKQLEGLVEYLLVRIAKHDKRWSWRNHWRGLSSIPHLPNNLDLQQ